MRIYSIFIKTFMVFSVGITFFSNNLYTQNSLVPGIDAFNPFFSYDNPFTHRNDEVLNEIKFDFGLDYGSNQITTEFFKTILFKQFISSAIKDPAEANLQSNNKIGANYGWKLDYKRIVRDKSGHLNRLLFSFASRQLISAAYSPDFFRLLFYGNSMMAGRTAEISPFNFDYSNYYQLKAGYMKSIRSGLGSLFISSALSLNFGKDYQEINIENASLFTALDGTYIDLNWTMNSFHAETLNQALINGFGPSLDLSFDLEHAGYWHLDLQDVGFIRWFANAASFRADTAIHWEGLALDNPFSAHAISTNFTQIDSVISLAGAHKTYGAKTIFIPWQMNVAYRNSIGNQSFFVQGGINYLHLPAYFPLFFIAGRKTFLNQKIAAEISISYGGFRTFDSGLRLAFSDRKRLQIAAGTNSLASFIIPDRYHSASVFFIAAYSF